MSEFDFEVWVAQAQEGLAHLKEQEKSLQQKREHIEEQLVQCGEEIAALEKMLQAAGSLPEPEAPPPIKRTYGIKKETRNLAETLARGVKWKEEQLIPMVLERFPTEQVQPQSVIKALSALTKEGVYIRTGQRGNWRYESTIGVNPVDATPTPVPLPIHRPNTDKPEPEAPEPETLAVFPGAAGPTDTYAEKPSKEEVQLLQDIKKTMEAIEKEMKKRKQLSISDSTIGYIARDLSVTPATVREALKILAREKYEIDYEGETKILRHKKTERERLKDTKVTDRPLFPDADRPEHA